jgi:hypothetical protein
MLYSSRLLVCRGWGPCLVTPVIVWVCPERWPILWAIYILTLRSLLCTPMDGWILLGWIVLRGGRSLVLWGMTSPGLVPLSVSWALCFCRR